MRRFLVMVLALFAVLVLGACGAQDGDDVATLEQGATACGEAEKADLDWSTVASDAGKVCSGAWERGGQCCDMGAQDSLACGHAHSVGSVTLSYANPGTEHCTRECVEYGGTGCNIPFAAGMAVCRCIAWETYCDTTYTPCSMAQATGTKAQALLNGVKAVRNACVLADANGAALNPPAPAITAMSSPDGGPTCNVTISNAVVGHLGEPNTCSSAKHLKVCQPDPATVKYAKCGAIGSPNLDGTAQTWVNSAACGATLAKVYEAPGMTRAAFLALDARYRDVNRCLTGEDVEPLGNPVSDLQVQRKFDALANLLQSGPVPDNDPQLRSKIAKHLKYLFEFHGDRLTDAQRATVPATVYQAYPEAPSCGSPLDAALTDWNASPATRKAAGDLLLCQRLSDPHARRATFSDQMAPFCAGAVGADLAGLAGVATPTRYTEPLALAAAQVLKTGFSTLDTASTTQATRLPILQRRLWLLGRWYDGAKAGAYASDAAGAAAEKLWTDASGVVGAIWGSVHAKDRAALAGVLPEQELETFIKAGFDSDAELLKAVFSTYQPLPPLVAVAPPPAPPLTGGPALMFVADGFRTMTERLDALTPVHDFGCLFLDCAARNVPGPAKSELKTELSTIYRLLGSLHDRQALIDGIDDGNAAAAAAGSYLSAARWNPWRDLFALVKDNHVAVVQPAVREMANQPAGATYDPAWVTGAASGAPRALTDFSATVTHGATRYATYKETGQFQYPAGRLLPVGLLASKILDIKNEAKLSGDLLGAEVDAYRGTVATLVANRLTDLQNSQSQAELADRKDQLLQQVLALSSDDAGLKTTAAMDQARFSDITARIGEVQAVLATEGASYTPELLVQSLPISSNASNWTSGKVTDVRAVAVTNVRAGGTRLAVGAAGDILQLDVTGTWSPTCALQAQNGAFYGVPLDTTGLRDAKTTSDGFSLSYSGGKFHTQAHSFTTSETWSASAEVCAGGGYFFVSAKACAGYATARTTTDARSDGSESRTSAAFAVGLRLQQTPFKDFPAGALIAVQVAPGTGRLIEASVVQSPRTALTLRQAADVYLVVNDLKCNNAGTGGLSVTATQLRPAGAKAQAVATAMSSVWTAKAAEMEAIVQQGRMLPDQAASFRSDAWQALRVACSAALGTPCEPTAYPPVLQGFFASWVDAQVVHLEREIDHLRIGREFDQLNRQIDTLTRDLESTARQGRYTSLMPAWTLQNLNLADPHLRLAVDDYMGMVRQVLYPMVRLRYPEALVGVNGADQLLKQDWYNVTISNVATALKNFGQSLSLKLELAVSQAASASGDALVTDAVVRFQNPYRTPISDPLGFTGRVVTDGRAKDVWDAINGRLPVTFNLTPEDLYQKGAVSTLLPCTLVAPSIRKMAFYVSTGNPGAATRNYDTNSSPTNFGRNMQFTTKAGVEFLEFGNEEWLTTNPKFLYGTEGDATNVFRNWDLATYTLGPSGLSPFDTWTVDPMVDQNGTNLGDPYGDATELLVVMQLEARRSATFVPGVGTCQP